MRSLLSFRKDAPQLWSQTKGPVKKVFYWNRSLDNCGFLEALVKFKEPNHVQERSSTSRLSHFAHDCCPSALRCMHVGTRVLEVVSYRLIYFLRRIPFKRALSASYAHFIASHEEVRFKQLYNIKQCLNISTSSLPLYYL